MSKHINGPKDDEKILYTCPCGFCSFDLIEFLKHPFMEEVAGMKEETAGKLQEEE
jgi:hypothetical protein